MKQNRTSIIFMLLGMATVMAFLFGVVYFWLERGQVTPYLNITFIPTVTEGENWLFFIGSFIFTFFLIMLFVYYLFKQIRKK